MLKSIFVAAALLVCYSSFSQIQLNFSGTPSAAGTPGTVGAIYTYANVGTQGGITVKAQIEIISLSGGAVLDNIDASSASGGTNEAWQPVIAGSQTSGNCWSVRFRISFYNAANNSPLTVSSFRASGVDIDGNGSTLREHNTFYYPYSYTVNNPTNLTITNTSDAYQFRAPSTSYAGIDLSQVSVAVTCLYTNKQSVDVAIGSCCIGGACNVAAGSGRQHSINFFQAVGFTSAMVTLPVRLVNFSATEDGSAVSIGWSSAEEIGLAHYVVEKSEDGRSFFEIGKVQATGSTGNYTFTDKTPINVNAAFYRLKSVDIDGSFSYSSIVRVYGKTGLGLLTVYPIPVTDHFNAVIESEKKQTIELRLINSDGKILHKVSRMVAEGSNSIPVTIQNRLTKGVYVLQAECADGTISSTKITVQ